MAFSAQQRGCYWGVVGASTLLGLGLLPEFTSAADRVLSTSTPAAPSSVFNAKPDSQPATGALHDMWQIRAQGAASVAFTNCEEQLCCAPSECSDPLGFHHTAPEHFCRQSRSWHCQIVVSGKAVWAAL